MFNAVGPGAKIQDVTYTNHGTVKNNYGTSTVNNNQGAITNNNYGQAKYNQVGTGTMNNNNYGNTAPQNFPNEPPQNPNRDSQVGDETDSSRVPVKREGNPDLKAIGPAH